MDLPQSPTTLTLVCGLIIGRNAKYLGLDAFGVVLGLDLQDLGAPSAVVM